MLTVGVDTYVTVEEATEYISSMYPSTDERLTAWAGLSENDQEVYLRRACAALSELPYRGVTFQASQPLPFPRFFGTDYVMAYRELIAPEAYIYPELQEVPANIKNAQIEEAFELACPSNDTQKHAIITGAVQSYSIGHFSEHYDLAQPGSLAESLKSGKARKLVISYLGGAHELC